MGLAPNKKPQPNRRGRARQTLGRADRVTLGLATLALGSIASVLGWTYLRRLYHRLAQRHKDPELAETATDAIFAAGRATQDTVRVAVEGYRVATKRERVLINLLTGFVGSFAIARLSTVGIRDGWWPLGNLRIGGRHIHHFVPGILLAFGAGGAAMITQSETLEKALAVPYGVGLGLTFDEAALLLDLRDVYWSREGLLSVQVSLGLVSVISGTIIAIRLLNRGERHAEELGWMPTAEGEILAPSVSAATHRASQNV